MSLCACVHVICVSTEHSLKHFFFTNFNNNTITKLHSHTTKHVPLITETVHYYLWTRLIKQEQLSTCIWFTCGTRSKTNQCWAVGNVHKQAYSFTDTKDCSFYTLYKYYQLTKSIQHKLSSSAYTLAFHIYNISQSVDKKRTHHLISCYMHSNKFYHLNVRENDVIKFDFTA